MPDDANRPQHQSQPPEGEAADPALPAWRHVVSSAEGKVFVLGVLTLALYVAAVLVARSRSLELYYKLWTMTTSHLLGGRAAGLSWGYQHELPAWAVIVCNMVIETFLVLLLFPLFVFSYRKLIVIPPLEETMARARRAAESRQKTIVKFGVPGLLLFVWFPFWMTGPLIGSIIGFLIGLRLWVNLTVVLLGTYLAILCWGIILQQVHEGLAALGAYVPVAFVGLILLVAVSVHIRYAFIRAEERREGKG